MTALTASIERRAGGFTLDVSFEAPPGVTGIIGASGAGKTMALQTIAGLGRPDKARIALGDEIFADTAEGISLPPDKRNIGYIFQEARLFPHMTVAANLDLEPVGYGFRAKQRRMKCKRAAGVLDLAAQCQHVGMAVDDAGGRRQQRAGAIQGGFERACFGSR